MPFFMKCSKTTPIFFGYLSFSLSFFGKVAFFGIAVLAVLAVLAVFFFFIGLYPSFSALFFWSLSKILEPDSVLRFAGLCWSGVSVSLRNRCFSSQKKKFFLKNVHTS